MTTPKIYTLLLLFCMIAFLGCEAPTEPITLTEEGITEGLSKNGNSDQSSVKGSGTYLLAETFNVDFQVNAKLKNGQAKGHFRQSLIADDLLISFRGEVTCLSFDPVTGRAWVGAIITRNDSEHPDFLTELNQPGKDVWFRVLDTGKGSLEADRSTFLGFEGGGGIITSQEYCDAQLWPDDNARTHPVTDGKIKIKTDD